MDLLDNPIRQPRDTLATWNSGFEPSVLTERIEKLKSVSSDGTVSFSWFAHTEHSSILASMLRLNGEIPENEARRLVNRAYFDAAAIGRVTPESLLAHADALERTYLSTPKSRFRLITSISANFASSPVAIRNGTAELRFGRRPSRSAERIHAEKIQDAEHSIYGSLPTSYAPVHALVSARNPDEAATQALDQIDLFRAIWNLWKNRSHSIRISSGKRSPVNTFILGPLHTLHKLNGQLATDEWWYEPTYLGPVSVWRDAPRLAKMLEFTKNVRLQLKKLPYRPLIETALIRYTRSLDSRDWNSCFLELWSILEALTGTTLNDSHKVTVRRSAFLFKNPDYSTLVLNHLRAYRNTAVHGGKQGQNVEPIMYQTKNFVEALLQFHLGRAGQFSTMAEVAAFFDLPPGLLEVDRQLARLKEVRKYLLS